MLLLCISALIAAIGLARGEVTAAFFVQSLDWSGLVSILIGFMCVIGSFASRGSFYVQFSRSAGSEGLDRRSARDFQDMLGSFYYLIFFVWIGALQLFLSMLIHHIAG